MNDNIIVLNTDDLPQLNLTDGGLWQNRTNGYMQYDTFSAPVCSVYIMGFNKIKKTRYATECVLKYTTDINYELILIDNGSDDGTFEYFKSVNHPQKTIIRVTKNIGIFFPARTLYRIMKGRYIIGVTNDCYVTENWLSNMLKCMESDYRIGYVAPVSSNVSNLQQVNLGYASGDFEDMQRRAAQYNKSNPSIWEERLRLISILPVMRREIVDLAGSHDLAYLHDFSEDDLSVRIRRAGYKLMLCRDTFVCHDHDNHCGKTLTSGRTIFQEKYHGLDAWDDVNNYERKLLLPLETVNLKDGQLNILSVDVRMGTPILEVRNALKRRGLDRSCSYAFTTQAKYYVDLQTVADSVQCDRIDFLQDYYSDDSFDIIVLGKAINTYNSPFSLIERLYNLLAPGGLLLFKLRNTSNYNSFALSAGLGGKSDEDLPINIPVNECKIYLDRLGGTDITINGEVEDISDSDMRIVQGWLKKLKGTISDQELFMFMVHDYCFCVRKPQ